MNEWAYTDGGPIVVLPAETMPKWGGSQHGQGGVTDYERAVNEELLTSYAQMGMGGIGSLMVGDVHVLILERELATTFITHDNASYITRTLGEPSREKLLASLGHVSSWNRFPLEISFASGAGVLFDSAIPGCNNVSDIPRENGVIVFQIEPGAYEVTYSSIEEIDFIRLRIRRR